MGLVEMLQSPGLLMLLGLLVGLTVDTAFIQQYRDNITQLVQQKASKLLNTIMVDRNFKAEFKFTDQLGQTEMQERISRHQDTPIIDPDHQRRRLSKRDFVHNVLFDLEDQLNMVIDPRSSYSESARMAAGRQIDDIIIGAYNATAQTGKTGSTPVDFLPANQIVVNASGLTKAKLLNAQQILDDNDVEEDNRFIAVKPRQIRDLLNTTEVASSDFNTVKALVEGQIDTWIGFKFVKNTRLTTDGTNRLVYAYHRAAMIIGIQKDMETRIDQRPDKNYAWQVFLSMSMGSTRLEEKRIVQIACSET